MNWLNSMLNMLTCAYNRKPDGNIGKLLRIFCDGLAAVETALGDTREWRDIHTAAGMVLDRLGENYGVSRSGADDVLYRIMIMTKMMAAYSGGDADTLIHACAALMDIDPADIRLTEATAQVTLTVDESDIPSAFFARQEAICGQLQQATAAGVLLQLELRQPIYQSLYHAMILHDVEKLTIRQVN